MSFAERMIGGLRLLRFDGRGLFVDDWVGVAPLNVRGAMLDIASDAVRAHLNESMGDRTMRSIRSFIADRIHELDAQGLLRE